MIITDMKCSKCGKAILSREKFLNELNKNGLVLNQQTNSITVSGSFSGHTRLDYLQLLAQKLEQLSAFKCNNCGKIYCLTCLDDAPYHSGGKACGSCFLHFHKYCAISHAHVSSNTNCFIATAIYGTCDNDNVLVLRNWRDNYLNQYYLGRLFVQIYYSIGPLFANLIYLKIIPSYPIRKFLDLIVNKLTKYQK